MPELPTQSVPLCVDLDGTLVQSDTLIESYLALLRREPMPAIRCLFALRKGKAEFKSMVAQSECLNTAQLGYNKDVIEYCKQAKGKRELVLVTGANQLIADRVAEDIGLFDRVLASSKDLNLTGNNKKNALLEEFGESGFDYIGNDRQDWKVWRAAREKLIVSREGAFLQESQQKFSFSEVFTLSKPVLRDWIKLIRVHQWAKNLLIFVPLLLEHRFSDLTAVLTLLGCFTAFSLLASLTYILNDLLDLESDRQNATKSHRPLASAKISLKEGAVAMAVLAAGVLLILSLLPWQFAAVLLVYTISTLMYSLFIKKMLYLDVCMLAGLHTMRIIAGTLAIQAEWSFWLLGFSMFFFLSLAIAKRVAELENLKRENRTSSFGRGYTVSDLFILIASGVSAGHASVLIIALYINSDKIARMYEVPQILWLLCPVLLYWIGRVWMITTRGGMHEDPILFAMRDRISQLTLGVCAVVVLAAILARKVV